MGIILHTHRHLLLGTKCTQLNNKGDDNLLSTLNLLNYILTKLLKRKLLLKLCSQKRGGGE